MVGETFELLTLAERYKVAKKATRKKELAEQFLDHLYELENAFQSLRQQDKLLEQMAAFADGRCKVGQVPSASAHEAVILVGFDVVTECADEFFRRAFPDEWPPCDPDREYIMPDKLPCRKDVASHVQAIIVRFQKKIDLPLDDLNDVSARLKQEYERLIATIPSPTQGVAGDNSGEWSLPATMNTWVKRFKATDRSLRSWRKKSTLRMMKVKGQRGLWRVHTRDPLYIQWDRSRTSLTE